MECARSIRGRLSLLSSISLAVSDVWSCYIDNLPLNASCALHTPPKGETPPRVVLPPCAVCRAQFPHSYKLQSMPCALLAHLFIFIAVVTAMHPISCTLPSPTAPSVLTERHVLKSKSKHYDCKERASTKVWKLIVSRGDICSGSGLQQNTATRY